MTTKEYTKGKEAILAKQVLISKDEFIEFFVKNYCDIEKADPLTVVK